MELVVPSGCAYQALPRTMAVPEAAIGGAPMVETGVLEETE